MRLDQLIYCLDFIKPVLGDKNTACVEQLNDRLGIECQSEVSYLIRRRISNHFLLHCLHLLFKLFPPFELFHLPLHSCNCMVFNFLIKFFDDVFLEL